MTKKTHFEKFADQLNIYFSKYPNTKFSKPFDPSDTVRTNPIKKSMSNKKLILLNKIKSDKIPELKNHLEIIDHLDLNLIQKLNDIADQQNKTLDKIMIELFSTQTTQNQNQDMQDQDQNQDMQNQNQTPDQSLENKTSSKITNMAILESSFTEFLNPTSQYYMPRNRELEVSLRAFRASKARLMLLAGITGTGKTLFSKTIGSILQIPTLFQTCHQDTDQSDLLGSIQLVNNSTVFQLGVLPLAIQCANDPNNKTKTALVILDEINTMTPANQKIFNSMLDFHDGIFISLIGKKYKLNPDSKIIVIGTCNPANYQGVNPLNAELINRSLVIDFRDLTDSESLQLLEDEFIKKKKTPKLNLSQFDKLINPVIDDSKIVDKETLIQLINLKSKINSAFDQQELEDQLTQRPLSLFAQIYEQGLKENLDRDQALTEACHLVIYGKTCLHGDPSQEKIALESLYDSFGIETKKIKGAIF